MGPCGTKSQPGHRNEEQRRTGGWLR